MTREEIGAKIAYGIDWPDGTDILRCGGTIVIHDPKSLNAYRITVTEDNT